MLTSLVLLLTWPPSMLCLPVSREDERSKQFPLPHWKNDVHWTRHTQLQPIPPLHVYTGGEEPSFCWHTFRSKTYTYCFSGPPPGGRHEKTKGAKVGKCWLVVNYWEVLMRKPAPGLQQGLLESWWRWVTDLTKDGYWDVIYLPTLTLQVMLSMERRLLLPPMVC